MSFDIAQADCATPSEEGRDFELYFADGRPMLHDDGRPVTITMRGRFSFSVQAADRDIANRRLDAQARGIRVTVESSEAEVTDILVAATKLWSFDTLDGQPFHCTPENARRFWTDARFAHLRRGGERFTYEDARFTKR